MQVCGGRSVTLTFTSIYNLTEALPFLATSHKPQSSQKITRDTNFQQPTQKDWDLVFPPGWHSADMAPYVDKVFSRIPWTDTPSMDGKRYFQDTAQRVTEVLASADYTSLSANEQPDAKSCVISNSEYMFLHGERGGIMATYLVSAAARKNFRLQMNTTVTRLVRKGDTVTGVEVEASGKGGYSGTISVTPNAGRVILSAGVFGTAKILFRSEYCLRPQFKALERVT